MYFIFEVQVKPGYRAEQYAQALVPCASSSNNQVMYFKIMIFASARAYLGLEVIS